MCFCRQSDKVYPVILNPTITHSRNKLDSRDSTIVFCAMIFVICCFCIPVCGIIVAPILYYIELLFRDRGTPTIAPTIIHNITPLLTVDNYSLNE